MRHIIIAVALLITTSATAHELTPTYPKLSQSFVDGVVATKMKLWNRRQDVSYYEIGVYDEEWNNLPFASSSRIMRIDYLASKNFEVYIKKKDAKKVEYICTTSKQLKEDVKSTGVKSRICSRVK